MAKKPQAEKSAATHFDRLVEDVEKILGFNEEVDELAIKLLQKIADWYPRRSIKSIRALAKMEPFHPRPHEPALEYEGPGRVYRRNYGSTEEPHNNGWDDTIRAIEDYGGSDD